MTQVIRLADLHHRCKTCHEVDCEDHCWECGKEHSYDDTDTHICMECDKQMENEDVGLVDEEDNLDGLWNPPSQPADVRVVVKHYRRRR